LRRPGAPTRVGKHASRLHARIGRVEHSVGNRSGLTKK
jgi:hypothetical protein